MVWTISHPETVQLLSGWCFFLLTGYSSFIYRIAGRLFMMRIFRISVLHTK